MTHKERVEAALAHKEADRVPVDIWGSASRICNELYFKIVEDQGWKGLGPCVKASRSGDYVDEGSTFWWIRTSGIWISGTPGLSPLRRTRRATGSPNGGMAHAKWPAHPL